MYYYLLFTITCVLVQQLCSTIVLFMLLLHVHSVTRVFDFFFSVLNILYYVRFNLMGFYLRQQPQGFPVTPAPATARRRRAPVSGRLVHLLTGTRTTHDNIIIII